MKTLEEILNESVLDLHKSLSDHYRKYSFVEADHLRNYTDDSSDLNGYHWEKRGKYSPVNNHYENKTKHIDAAINRHSTPHELTVHSGIQYDPRKTTNSEGIVTHPAYLSSSLKKKTARSFSRFKSNDIEHGGGNPAKMNNHMLSIKVPAGHPGAYVGDISHVKTEREFILPRNTKMKHIRTTSQSRKHKLYGNMTDYTHHMEIVK